jgi:LuxR family maltose regulon positive regulatory protein
MPPLASDVIVRRRLLAVLREGLRGPLTLVTAPAGYGKTVLVRSWAADEDASSTVLSTTLDDDDPSPVDFWASLLEGLRGAGVDVCDVHVPGSTAAVDRPMIGRLAQRIAAHGGPVVWVLDCGEFTLPPALGEALHRLMTRSAGGLRLVLLTRTDPPLPLNRYVLNGALTEIRAADLSFTASEASRLMQRVGLHLDPADVDTLRVRTRGWPAGLRFAAMGLAGRADTREAIREFRGDTQNVAGYLMTEVLAKQPPAMRNFLLRTCLVDELEPGIVEALTGQRSDVRALEFMAHGNTFVEPVLGRPGHFRYQPLFREFLRSQLSFEDPELAAVLHLEAADWLAQSGQPLAAIRHAVLGQAWSKAAGHFVEGLCYAGLLTGRHRRLLESLFAGLPADFGGVEGTLTRAALALSALDTRRATPALEAARAQLDEDQSLGSRGCATAIAVLEAVAASLGTDTTAALEAAVVAERALELMPAQDEVAHSELVAVAAGCKGRALLELGDLAAAAASLGEGISAARDPHLAGLLSELTGLAALVEAMAGHLQRASGMASGLLPPTDGVGADVASVPRAASLALAWVRLDEYDLPAAQRILSSRARMTPSLDATVLLKVEALLHARLWAAREEFDLARAELRAAMPSEDMGSVTTWLDHLLVANQAALSLAQAAPEDAIAMIQSAGECEHLECARLLQQALSDSGRTTTTLQRLSPASIARQPLAVQVNTWLLQAEHSIQEGDSTSGEVCLETALRLAAPERLRRPFLEVPDTILPLLGHSGLAASHRWLEATPSTAGEDVPFRGTGVPGQPGGTGGRPAAAPIVNPLTKKEREVLGYLAELLTTDEIAKTMFVSVNTVRSHVRSILRKLSVARRNEAVRRAWELNLLPPREVA